MKKILIALVAFAAALPIPALANHGGSMLSNPVGLPLEGAPVVEHGDWDFIANFAAGPGDMRPVGIDVEPFTRKLKDGVHKYVIMSSTTLGFSIFDVTDPDSPERVSDYGASLCGPEANALQLANGQEPGPFDAVHGWEGDIQITFGGKIAVYATDAAGRCHDPLGGGLELVDVSDLANPKLLGLVRLNADSHNSTVDKDRPWIIYNSNSDTRSNNFMDIVDIRSCFKLDPKKCHPDVARLQFKDVWTTSPTTASPSACHDITYAEHKLYGACINGTLVWDPKNVYKNGHLTGSLLTSKTDVGKDACTIEPSSVEAMSDATVTNCYDWTMDKFKKAKLENAHLKLLIHITHEGLDLDEDTPPDGGLQIAHKSDPGLGGKIIMVNDERGGGTNTSPGECPGGAIWFYDVRNPKKPAVAKLDNGKPAAFVPAEGDFVQTQGNSCTSHLFWEWKPQNHLVSAAWYTSGTQVFRYKVDTSTTPATVEFTDRMAYVPPGAATWTSRIIAQKKTDDGTVLYFAATDIARGYDFFKLTLPKK